jgi:hypothetical protein
MEKPCSRCEGTMRGEDNDILKSIPLAMGLSIPVEKYIPNVIKAGSKYRTFVCQYCGFVEFYVGT